LQKSFFSFFDLPAAPFFTCLRRRYRYYAQNTKTKTSSVRADSVDSRRRLLHQGIRFVLTGGINTGFSYAIYAACIFAGAGYALASAASMAAGILFSYKTASSLVFRDAHRRSLLRYAGCYLVVYGFSVLLLRMMDSLGIDPYLSGLVVAVPAAMLSFALLKLFVFRTHGAGRDGSVDRHPGL
jgi:putative flippase GtrA